MAQKIRGRKKRQREFCGQNNWESTIKEYLVNIFSAALWKFTSRVVEGWFPLMPRCELETKSKRIPIRIRR
jgi:hypothetical protein